MVRQPASQRAVAQNEINKDNMKATKILIAMLASAFIVTACDPIEDEDLRDKYVTDAGTPITKEALQAAISITQPFPNQDGVVEGDQYIALKNSRPDIGGSWHIEWGTKEVNKVRHWSRTRYGHHGIQCRLFHLLYGVFPPIKLSRQSRL